MDDRDPWPTWNYRVDGGTCSFPTRGNRTGTPKGPRPHVCRPPPDTDRSSRDLVHISRGSRANKTRMNGMRWMDDRWMMMMAARPAAPRMCGMCLAPGLTTCYPIYPPLPRVGPAVTPGAGVCRGAPPGVPYTSARGSSVPCRRPAAGLRGGSHPLGRARRLCPGVWALRRPQYGPGTIAVTPRASLSSAPRAWRRGANHLCAMCPRALDPPSETPHQT